MSSQAFGLLDSAPSLQVGFLLPCLESKDSRRRIQLNCCFLRLAETMAACNSAQGSQAAAGRFPEVKGLRVNSLLFFLESLHWLEKSFRYHHTSLVCYWSLNKPWRRANIPSPLSLLFDWQHAFMRHPLSFLYDLTFSLCEWRDIYNNHCYLSNTHCVPGWTMGVL